jgi:hypothetical protein
MKTRAALFLLPLVIFGQTPPAEVDQALRARTNEFFQDFVDGQYRKALSLVAEDTQEEYFASPKAEIKSFKIDNVKYNDDFSKATVNLTVKRVLSFQGQTMVPEVPMITTWKIESGKWVWYNEAKPGTWVTAMGPSDVTLVSRGANGGVVGLPDKLDQSTVDAAGMKIIQQSGLDKQFVTMALDKVSTDTVMFRNGAPGSVHLELGNVPKIAGLSVKLDKADVNLGESVPIRIRYEPNPDPDSVPPPPNASIPLIVAPFNQQLTVQVNWSK